MMKWLDAVLELSKGNQPTCPNCGKRNLDYGYMIADKKNQMGFGIVWCKNCNHAFSLSRANLKNETKILNELPKNLVY